MRTDEEGGFELLREAGLYVPLPTMKRAVKLSSEKFGQLIDAPDIIDVAARIDTYLADSEAGPWLTFHDPLYGEQLLLHRRFLEALQGVGYDWVDLEAVRLQQQEREHALRMQKSGLATAVEVPGQPLPFQVHGPGKREHRPRTRN